MGRSSYRRKGKKGKLFLVLLLLISVPVLAYYISNKGISFDKQSNADQSIPSPSSGCSLPNPKISTLSKYAATRNLNISTLLSECFSDRNTDQKDKCKEIIKTEYSGMMVQMQGAWRDEEKVKGTYDFTKLDEMQAFAKENNFKTYYHHLLWTNAGQNKATPKWLFPAESDCGKWTKEQLLEIMKNRIQTVINHTEGTTVAWNVINEAFRGNASNGYIVNDCFYKIIGKEYIDQAFIYAREASPNGLLVLNETFGNGRMDRAKIDVFLDFVKSAKGRGVPIDAIGIQNHLTSRDGKHFSKGYLEDLDYFFKRASRLDVKILITEMDIYQAGHTQRDVARLYKKVLAKCLDNSNCISFATFGISDKYSWLRNEVNNLKTAKPLLFDEEYKKKISYDYVMDAIRQNRNRGCVGTDTTPITNEEFTDSFKDNVINERKWNTYQNTPKIVIQEKDASLKITIPSGATNGKANSGGMSFTTIIPEDSDFKVNLSLAKPTITGKGTGVTGLGFATNLEDSFNENIRIAWRVTANSNQLALVGTDINGVSTEYGRATISASKIAIQLIRVGNLYIANYKDIEKEDQKWIKIGQGEITFFTEKGRIRIFSNNLGTNKQYPKIENSIESFSLSWFDKTK